MERNSDDVIRSAQELAKQMTQEARERGSRSSFSVQIGTELAPKTVYVRKEKPDGLEIVLYTVGKPDEVELINF